MSILLFIIIFKVIYLSVLYYLHQLELPRLDLPKLLGAKDNYKVLVIYPHPDDETMASGGLLAQLGKDKRFDVTCVSITHGEHGDEKLQLPPAELAQVRAREFRAAVSTLGDIRQEIWGYTDGGCKKEVERLQGQLRAYLIEQRFDLVVTYERAGLYGHPDHIVLSRVVHQLQRELGNFKVLYMTLAQNLLRTIKLPLHMMEEEDKHLQQAAAEFKLFLGRNVWKRYQAALEYKSQKLNHNMPLWGQMFVMPFEYYTTKYK